MFRFHASPDVLKVIGDYAQNIENRSLIFDKYMLNKKVHFTREWDKASLISLCKIAEPSVAIKNLRRDYEKSIRNNKDNDAPEKIKVLDSINNSSWKAAESNYLSEIATNYEKEFYSLLAQSYGETSTRIYKAKLMSRLVINLSDGVIENAGISLHRQFGRPYLPASAIKGVCRHVALWEIKQSPKNSESRLELLKDFCSIFGVAKNDFEAKGNRKGDLYDDMQGINPNDILPKNTKGECIFDLKGAIEFLPSYALGKVELEVDISTVHYPKYYRLGNIAELRTEDLKPNYFPCIKEGAEFGFAFLCLHPESARLLERVKSWLEQALTVHGIGAKTASGYGWFGPLSSLTNEEIPLKTKAEENITPVAVLHSEESQPQEKRIDQLTEQEQRAIFENEEKFKELSEEEKKTLVQALHVFRQSKASKWKKHNKDYIDKLTRALNDLN